jgi:16S rRNA (guanine966-N2)-methyltransferase
VQSWAVDFDDVRVLDLYAGSGALGFELLSRGAHAATLVEKDASAASLIKANATQLELPQARVVTSDAISFLTNGEPEQFDVVFADPPYAVADEILTNLLDLLVERNWLANIAIVVIERDNRSALVWPNAYSDVEQRTYGDTALWYGQYRRPKEGAPNE